MKRFFFLILFLSLISLPALSSAQSFTWNIPHNVMVGNPGDFLSNHTYLINNTSSPLSMRVILLQPVMPAGWGGFYCTPLGCFTFDVDTSFVFTLAVANFDSLLIDFTTDPTTPAVGSVIVKVENANNPSEFMVEQFYATTGPSALGDEQQSISNRFHLGTNYPNPFNPSTTIPFEIEGSLAAKANLTVYNILGQPVRMLVNTRLNPGAYQITWDARDETGRKVPSGIYFYVLRAGGERLIGKMALLK